MRVLCLRDGARSLQVIQHPHVWENAAMSTLTRNSFSLNLRRSAGHRQVGEHDGRPSARLYSTLVITLALSSSMVHAQTPTCVAPGCNSVQSDNALNTAMGGGTLVILSGGQANTASGDFALFSDNGSNNTALGEQTLEGVNTNGNTALGVFAIDGDVDLIGNNNTVSGVRALFAGNNNTASGTSAFFWDEGNDNTGSGFQVLLSSPPVPPGESIAIGNYNTASGSNALSSEAYGNANTAAGYIALADNTTGNDNVAVGEEALASNSGASGNTASGYRALKANTTGANNAALGDGALQFNVGGSDNTAAGAFSLFSNTSGNYNAASGYQALFANTTASSNTASGFRALYLTTTGDSDTAAGFLALVSNTTGKQNTAVGAEALHSNTTGLNNIGIGNNAGYAVTGSNNIDIGNQGISADAGTIRIGASSTQSKAFIAGIYGTPLIGSAVYVTATGQLGVLGSSERFKTDIAPMPDPSDKLRQLLPVAFHYKTDPQAIPQYGLIAEEVDKVYPELVIRDEAGKIQGVRYEELAPMLLSEMQRKERKIDAQAAQISELKQQLAGIRAALVTLQPKEQLVAQR
jgi:trimeric autotransporter adhesin